MTTIMIPLVTFTHKDFSLMKKAEREAASKDYSFDEALPTDAEKADGYSLKNAKPIMVILPIVVTFAIMMPLAIPMAHAFGIPYAIATGAVLSGGLFGDHCSPISDTTILSSTGTECDLVERVKTQLPYAAVNGVIAVGCYILVSFTHSPLIVLLAVALQAATILIRNRLDLKKV